MYFHSIALQCLPMVYLLFTEFIDGDSRGPKEVEPARSASTLGRCDGIELTQERVALAVDAVTIPCEGRRRDDTRESRRCEHMDELESFNNIEPFRMDNENTGETGNGRNDLRLYESFCETEFDLVGDQRENETAETSPEQAARPGPRYACYGTTSSKPASERETSPAYSQCSERSTNRASRERRKNSESPTAASTRTNKRRVTTTRCAVRSDGPTAGTSRPRSPSRTARVHLPKPSGQNREGLLITIHNRVDKRTGDASVREIQDHSYSRVHGPRAHDGKENRTVDRPKPNLIGIEKYLQPRSKTEDYRSSERKPKDKKRSRVEQEQDHQSEYRDTSYQERNYVQAQKRKRREIPSCRDNAESGGSKTLRSPVRSDLFSDVSNDDRSELDGALRDKQSQRDHTESERQVRKSPTKEQWELEDGGREENVVPNETQPSSSRESQPTTTTTTGGARGRGNRAGATSSIDPDSGTYVGPGGIRLYTFIVHGVDGSKFGYVDGKRRKCRPNYIWFDHGDHIHVAYVSTVGNYRRSLARIQDDMDLSPAARTQSQVTLVQIHRTPNHFIMYLARKGMKTVTVVGKGLDKDPKLRDLFADLLKTTEVDDELDHEPCQQYFEEKRTDRRKAELMKFTGYRKCSNHFIPFIRDNNITTMEQLMRAKTFEETVEYYNQWGPNWKVHVEELIKLYNNDLRAIIRAKTYWSLIKEEVKDKTCDASELKWVKDLFKANEINLVDILAKFVIVREGMMKKRNTLVLCGPANCGKSMIIDWLTKCLKPVVLPKQADLGPFFFSKLVSATSVLLEEPLIWHMNVNAYKTLLGGESYSTDVKNKDMQDIARLPFFITTNETSLGQHCDPINQEALASRCFQFLFKAQIIHGDTQGTIVKHANENISSVPLHKLMLYNKVRIENRISTLLREDRERAIRERRSVTDQQDE